MNLENFLILLNEELGTLLEMAVANFSDRAGQLTNIRNDAEARQEGWSKLGRAVYNNGQLKVGPMSQDHIQMLKSIGGDGLRFFWGVKGNTFLFTGKNQQDLETLYRIDKQKQANGRIVVDVITQLMKKANAVPTSDFKNKFRETLIDAGVYKP
jgi:hypothetical protein